MVEAGRHRGHEHREQERRVDLPEPGEREADEIAAPVLAVEALAAGQRVLDAEPVERSIRW